MRRNVLLATIVISSLMTAPLMASKGKRADDSDRESPPPKNSAWKQNLVSTNPDKKKQPGGKQPAKVAMEDDGAAKKLVVDQQQALVDKLKQESEALALENEEIKKTLVDAKETLKEDEASLAALLQQKTRNKKEVQEQEEKKRQLEEEQAELRARAAEEEDKIKELELRKAEIDRQIREGEALLAEQRLNGSQGPEEDQFKQMRAELEVEWQQRMKELEQTKADEAAKQEEVRVDLQRKWDLLQASQKQNEGTNANSNAPREDSIQQPQPNVDNSNNDDKKDAAGEVKKDVAGEEGKGQESSPDSDKKLQQAGDPKKVEAAAGTDDTKKQAAESLDKDLDAQSYPRPSSGGYLQWALETGKEVASQGANMVVNYGTRFLKSREDRLAKGTCPLISVTELRDLFDKVWYPQLTLEQKNALTYASLHYNNQKPGQFKLPAVVNPDDIVIFPPHFESDGGYFYFPVRFTCGIMRTTFRDPHKESKVVADKTMKPDEKNKLRFDKYVKALQSPNEEEMLDQFDANFNEDPSAKPYEWLTRMWPLFDQGPNYQFWRDLKYSGRSKHSSHTSTRIVIRATAFEPLVRVLEDEKTQVKGSGEVLHFSIYGIRYRGKVTPENVRQLYDQFLSTESDDWLVK